MSLVASAAFNAHWGSLLRGNSTSQAKNPGLADAVNKTSAAYYEHYHSGRRHGGFEQNVSTFNI